MPLGVKPELTLKKMQLRNIVKVMKGEKEGRKERKRGDRRD